MRQYIRKTAFNVKNLFLTIFSLAAVIDLDNFIFLQKM